MEAGQSMKISLGIYVEIEIQDDSDKTDSSTRHDRD
jgi:hypothetical protein